MSCSNDGAIVATRDLSVSRNSFTLDADDNVARNLIVTNQGILNLHSNTAATNGTIFWRHLEHGKYQQHYHPRRRLRRGSSLQLGAPLDLIEDLDIRGTGLTAATVQANGQAIMARDIFIGRLGNRGEVMNDGPIVARRDFQVSAGTFTFDADDRVGRNVIANNGATLVLHPSTAAAGVTVSGGSTLNTVSTGNISTW